MGLWAGCCGVGEGVQLSIQHRFTTTPIRLPITRRFLYLAIYLLDACVVHAITDKSIGSRLNSQYTNSYSLRSASIGTTRLEEPVYRKCST